MSRDTSHPGDMRTVAGQTLWNLFGMVTPLVVALIAIPLLLEHLGKDRFGVLGIIGLLIGYLSVFDLGIGQAQAYLIADCRGRGDEARIPALFQTATLLVVAAGLVFGILFYLLAPALATSALNVPLALQGEVTGALRAAALAIPFAMLAPCLIATLEAYQEFRLISILRIPTSASYFLAPLLVIPFTQSLPAVILAMLAGRILETLAFGFVCLRHIHGVFGRWRFSGELCRRMLGFGGWMTTSNIVLPLLIHGDRFVLGALRNLTMVTYYVTPAEIIVRLLILPRALVTVLFPNLTMRFAAGTQGTEQLLAQSLRLLLAAMGLVAAALVCLGPWGLELWLGREFREHSGPILRWLAVGILFLGLAYVPQYLIQASGRPRVTALLHLCEIPLYLGLAALGVALGDATGIAIAWALRCGIDLVLMLLLACRCLPSFRHELRGVILRIFGTGLVLAGLILLPGSAGLPWEHLLALPILVIAAWGLLLGGEERGLLLSFVGKLARRA